MLLLGSLSNGKYEIDRHKKSEFLITQLLIEFWRKPKPTSRSHKTRKLLIIHYPIAN